MLAGDVGEVAAAALEGGAAALDRFRITLFRPLLPMLARPVESVADVYGTIDDVALELKLDGARVQAHKSGDEVRIYSRGLHDVTGSVPEVVAAVAALPVESAILDGEAIALRGDGRPHRFQATMARFSRKSNRAGEGKVALSSFFFDALMIDGDSLLERPAAERFEALGAAVPEAHRVERIIGATPAEAEAFVRAALDRGHEGVMAKSLASLYAAGARGASWLKLKPVYTFDLVVLAAEWGSGRRKGWLSNLHLGARDPDSGTFVMLGKTFKGMTDKLLAWQTDKLLELETGRDGHVVSVKPELVVEIAIGGVLASPHYPAGLALRFARVKRYRPDKEASEADTVGAIRAIYEQG
jgi:DNA ligase-1